MAWNSLIVSADGEALDALISAQQELGIATETRSDSARALEAIAGEKFDVVVCDFDLTTGTDTPELLRRLRVASNNAKVLMIGLVSDPGDMQATFEHGANFVIHKPLTREVVRRTLRAVVGVLHRSARRFPRREVETLALVEVDGATDKAMMMELGEGGMSMQALEQLEVRRPLHIHFQIPGSDLEVEATAEIAWADA